MASKRRNMFHKNKTQETMEKGTYFRRLLLLVLVRRTELYCDYPQSLKLKMAFKRRNMFYENEKQEIDLAVPTDSSGVGGAVGDGAASGGVGEVSEGVATVSGGVGAANSGGCPPPGLSLRGVRVVARPGAAPDYATLAEVRFTAELPYPLPFGPKKTLCKIKCVDNHWLGPLCQHDNEDVTAAARFQPLLRSCRVERRPMHIIITYRNITISGDNVSFPHGSVLNARCKLPLGLYKLSGENSLTCNNGQWSSRMPSCIPTTVLTNYTDDSPPTVLVRIPSGSASVEPTGILAVYPGSILHLECLFPRRDGNPEWTWTSAFRHYLTGWAIAPEEREWKYRLSMYYTKHQDSGVFTCATPRGLTNSINLVVTDVQCDPKEIEAGREDGHLNVRLEGSRLGHKAVFTCPTGFRLNGTANLTCRANGKWSGEVPKCEAIMCAELVPTDPRLVVGPHNTSYGARVAFSCPWGYKLQGSPGAECEIDSTWSAPLPNCTAVRCPTPVIPSNGRLVEDESGGEYGVGAVIQFACQPRHHLEGEGSIVCTDTGVWSHPPPFCKPHCDYPGEPLNGRLVPLKFTYEPGDRLKVTCHVGYVTRLQAKAVCLTNGTWSQPLPQCIYYRQV